MNIKNYKHIIWDWNGTLLDDAWLCLEIVNSILVRCQLPEISSDYYQDVFTFPVKDYYEEIGFDFSKESFESISSEFIEEYERKRKLCQLRYDALEVIGQISQSTMTQSVLSASKKNYLAQAVTDFDLDKTFTAVNGIDNHHAAGKVELGKEFVSRQGFKPQEVLMIGDTIHDVEVAEAMEVDCWLIPSGHQSAKRLSTCGVRVIDCLSSLRI